MFTYTFNKTASDPFITPPHPPAYQDFEQKQQLVTTLQEIAFQPLVEQVIARMVSYSQQDRELLHRVFRQIDLVNCTPETLDGILTLCHSHDDPHTQLRTSSAHPPLKKPLFFAIEQEQADETLWRQQLKPVERLLIRIPKEERAHLLATASLLLQGIHAKDEKIYLLKTLVELSLQDREELPSYVASSLLRIPDGTHRADILRSLALIPREQRTGPLITCAIRLLEERTSIEERVGILRTIDQLPLHQRCNHVMHIAPFMSSTDSRSQRESLVEMAAQLMKLPTHDKINFVTSRLLNGSPEDEEKKSVLFKLLNPAFHTNELWRTYIAIRLSTEQFEDTDYFRDLYNLIELISRQDRNPKTVFAAINLLKDLKHPQDRRDIIQIFEKLLRFERADLLVKGTSASCAVVHLEMKSYIFKLLALLPPPHRSAEMATHISNLLKNISDIYQSNSIVKTVTAIPLDARADLLKVVTPFLSHITNGYQKADILHAISEIPQNQRAETLSLTAPYFTHKNYKNQINKSIKAYLLAPEHIDAILDSLQEIHDHQLLRDIFQLLMLVPKEESIMTTVTAAVTLLTKLPDSQKRQDIIREIANRLPANRSLCIQHGALVIESDFYLMWRTREFFDYIESIPADILKSTLPFLSKIDKIFTKISALKFIEEIPEDQRDHVIARALSFLDNLDHTDLKNGRKLSILQLAYYISDDNGGSANLTAAIQKLDQLKNKEQESALLKILNRLPPEERNLDIFPILVKILDRAEDINTSDLLETIHLKLEKIPTADIAGILRRTAAALEYVHGPNNQVVLIALFRTLMLVSPDPDTTLQLHQLLPSIDWSGNVMLQLFEDKNIREASHRYLQSRLADPLSLENHEDLWKLIKRIVKYMEALHLDENHPIIFSAASLGAVCDPNVVDAPKNPYRILKALKDEHASLAAALNDEQGDLLLNVPVYLPNPPQELFDRRIQWSLNTLRAKALTWNGYSRSQLPEEVNSDTLHELFSAMTLRIAALSEEQRQEIDANIEAFITDQELTSIENLNDLFQKLITSSTIRILLTLNDNGQPDDPVTPSQFQLFMILKNIRDTDDTTLAPGSLLTLREDKLVNLAAMVQNCPTGQKSGILTVYNRLPACYKSGPEPFYHQASETVVARIDTAVQSGLEQTFASEPFLLDAAATDDESVVEAAHQTLYLKNRYYPWVGLRGHQLVFDVCTELLYDNLVNTPPSQTIDTIIRHLTPIAIREVIIASEELFKLKEVDSALLSFLQAAEPSNNYMVLMQKFVEFSDDETMLPQRLTPHGAIALLTALGYIGAR